MLRKEKTRIVLSSQEKWEFARVLDELDGEAKALFHILVFFYPNPTALAQSLELLKDSVSLTHNTLEQVTEEINTILEKISSSSRVHRTPKAFYLKRLENIE